VTRRESVLHRTSFAVAIVGLATSSYLAWEYARGGVIACPVAGTGCDDVRQSQFSAVLGIPVPWLGIAYYSSFALIEAVRQEFGAYQRFVGRLIVGLAVIGVLASAWFTYLEAFVISAWCFWCVVSAGCALALLLVTTAIEALQSRSGAGHET
jgi:uncharacterized membrane protein